jgi:hypothetical protein
LRVDYVVTVDDFDGAPLLPGFVDDGIFWALVARLHEGRTQWRRTLEKKWLSEYGALCLRLSAAEPLVVIPRHIWGPYPRRDAAMTMPLELFAGPADPPCHAAAAPIDPLYGLFVQLSDTCRCGSRVAIIGEGKGPHRASLFCERCGTHRGWMANAAHAFVSKIIEKFGKPTTPIRVRRNNSEGEQK